MYDYDEDDCRIIEGHNIDEEFWVWDAAYKPDDWKFLGNERDSAIYEWIRKDESASKVFSKEDIENIITGLTSLINEHKIYKKTGKDLYYEKVNGYINEPIKNMALSLLERCGIKEENPFYADCCCYCRKADDYATLNLYGSYEDDKHHKKYIDVDITLYDKEENNLNIDIVVADRYSAKTENRDGKTSYREVDYILAMQEENGFTLNHWKELLKNIRENWEVEVSDIRFLTREEFEKYADNIPCIAGRWWLAQPEDCKEGELMLKVFPNGNVTHKKQNFDYVPVCFQEEKGEFTARPVLVLKDNDYGIGTIITKGKTDWVKISDDLAISKEGIEKGVTYPPYDYNPDHEGVRYDLEKVCDGYVKKWAKDNGITFEDKARNKKVER